VIETNPIRRQADAERRTAILERLAVAPRCSRADAREAAAELGISERQVFALVRRLRMANGDPASVLPRKSSGGRGLPRIAPAAEQMVHDVINGVLQSMHHRPVPEIIAEVQRRSLELGFIYAATQPRPESRPAKAPGPARSRFARTAARPHQARTRIYSRSCTKRLAT
jgi:hypothetical protein